MLVILDPPGNVPIFLAVTRQLNNKERHRAAALAICTAFFVILVFALGGQTILDYLNVSVPALQGAGGLLLLLVAIISSKGAAGVTGAGFITLAATLAVVPAVPVAGMALILGIDRFMSECRAITNFVGNAVATIVVARWEGALDTERLSRELKGQ